VAITLQWSTAPTRQEVVKYLQAAEGFNKEHLRTLRQTQVWLAWLFLARCLAAFGTAGLLVFLFRRGIRDRFAVLVGNTRRLAQGQELAPRLAGTDEIAGLDGVFHEMAQALGEAVRRERTYVATLEQRVAERTAELLEVNRDLAHQNQENE